MPSLTDLLRTLSKKSIRRQRSTSRAPRRVHVEALETRAMLTTTLPIIHFFETTFIEEGNDFTLHLWVEGVTGNEGNNVTVDVDLNSDGTDDLSDLVVKSQLWNFDTESPFAIANTDYVQILVPWSQLAGLGVDDGSLYNHDEVPFDPLETYDEYTITATVVDENLNENFNDTELFVVEVVPTVETFVVTPGTGCDGLSVDLSATFAEHNPNETDFVVYVDWDYHPDFFQPGFEIFPSEDEAFFATPTGLTNASGENIFSVLGGHEYAAPGTYIVALRVTADFTVVGEVAPGIVIHNTFEDTFGGGVDDENDTISLNLTGGGGSASATINGAPPSSPEGTPIALTSTAGGSCGGTIASYAWEVFKNGVSFDTGFASTFSFTPNDNAAYVVNLTVIDSNSQSATALAQTITVTNVAPAGVLSGATAGVPGQLLSFGATATDASSVDQAAGLTLSIDWGDGNVQTPSATPTHAYANVGTYTVTLTATDKDNSSATTTQIVNVAHTLQQGGNLFVGGSNASDSITFDHSGVGNIQVSINNSAVGSFSDVTLATIYGGDGTSGNSDTLTVNGTTAADVIHKGDGIITLGSPIAETINYSGISRLVIDGREGNDTITDPGQDTTILGGSGDDTIIIDATTGSGVVIDGGDGSDNYIIGGGQIGDLSGPVTITDTGTAGNDTVEIVGTDGDDTITQSSTGFDLNGASISFGAGLETASVDGGGGNDEVIATGSPPVPVVVEAVSDMVVIGTTGNDHINFTPGVSAGEIVAQLNGVEVSRFSPAGKLVARGGDGDDQIHVAGSIDHSAWLYGGAGNDRLKGGPGHDVLLGEAGNDLLVGGPGRDILIGGDGQDAIHGKTEDDILVSGIVDFGANVDAALTEIQTEWTSSHSFIARTANIEGWGCSPTTYRLNSTTVLDDNDKDTLAGDQGIDWFFANLWLDGDDEGTKDKIIDVNFFELLFANDLDF